MPAFWTWNATTRRYHITAEGAEATGQKPGQFVGHAKRLELRDLWSDKMKTRSNALALDYADGELTLNAWAKAFGKETQTAYINQYLLGAGGRNSMSPADWGRLGNAIRDQYDFLEDFAEAVKNGDISADEMRARASKYMDGSTTMFERAEVLSRGMPELPTYPANGDQKCLTGCKCNWRVRDRKDWWECIWRLESGVKHCETCLGNAERWSEQNPLIIMKVLA